MTTYQGMTKSNYVEVEDKQTLQDLVNEVQEQDWAYFHTYWHDGRFAIGCDNGPIFVEQDHVDRILEVLGECISEPMVIRSVGYEGMRHIPDTWQWVVYPDGSWEEEHMTQVQDLSEDR